MQARSCLLSLFFVFLTACEHIAHQQTVNDPRSYHAQDSVGVWLRVFDRRGHEVKDTRFAKAVRAAAMRWLEANHYALRESAAKSSIIVTIREAEWGDSKRVDKGTGPKIGNVYVAGDAKTEQEITRRNVFMRVLRLAPHLTPEEISRGSFSLLDDPFPYEHRSLRAAVDNFLSASPLGRTQQVERAVMQDKATPEEGSGCWARLGIDIESDRQAFKIASVNELSAEQGLQVGDTVVTIGGSTPLQGFTRTYNVGESVDIQIERDRKKLIIPLRVQEICLDAQAQAASKHPDADETLEGDI